MSVISFFNKKLISDFMKFAGYKKGDIKIPRSSIVKEQISLMEQIRDIEVAKGADPAPYNEQIDKLKALEV